MTIELSRGKSKYIYRINPDNPRVVDRRLNQHNARWQLFRLCASEQVAKDSLFRLERQSDK